MKTAREILENLSGIGKDCEPRMTIDQALLALREVVVFDKRDTFGAKIDIFKAPNLGWNEYREELLHRLNGEG